MDSVQIAFKVFRGDSAMMELEAAERLMLAISVLLLAFCLVAIIGYRIAVWLDKRTESKKQAAEKVKSSGALPLG